LKSEGYEIFSVLIELPEGWDSADHKLNAGRAVREDHPIIKYGEDEGGHKIEA